MKNLSGAGKKLITRCPFCGDDLAIARLLCCGCKTQIDSELQIPLFFRLPPDLQEFVMIFLRCQGKIRDMEKELQPTQGGMQNRSREHLYLPGHGPRID